MTTSASVGVERSREAFRLGEHECVGREPGLLPQSSKDATADALLGLFLLLSKDREQQVERSRGDAESKQHNMEALEKQIEEKIRKLEEMKNSPGFFECIGNFVADLFVNYLTQNYPALVKDAGSDVETAVNSPNFWADLEKAAKFVATAASAVGTALTGGAASPVLVACAVSLSVGGFVVGETKCFGNEASGWISFGMQALGAGLNIGGSLAKAGAAGASQMSAGAGFNAAGGAGEVIQGAAHAGRVVNEHRAEELRIDQRERRAEIERLQRAIETLLSVMKKADEAKSRAIDKVRGAIHTKIQADTAVYAMTKG